MRHASFLAVAPSPYGATPTEYVPAASYPITLLDWPF